jgi:hypothetical protein
MTGKPGGQGKPGGLWNRNQKIGQLVRGQITGRAEGGYVFSIQGEEKTAFLQTEESISPKQEVLARVIGFDRRGIIAAPEFTQGSSSPARRASIVDQLDPNTHELRETAPSVADADVRSDNHLPVYTETLAHVYKKSTGVSRIPIFNYRRRICDLVPNLPVTEYIDPSDDTFIDQSFSYVEGGMRTAIIKGSSDSRLSRFLILCYRGRLLGCSYGRRDFPAGQMLPIPDAFKMAVADLPESKTEIIDVPEQMMPALAALYCGHDLELPDLPSLEVFERLGAQFQERRLTGCIVAFDEDREQTVGFVYAFEGGLVGYFDVLEQQYGQDLTRLRERLAQPGILLKASIITDTARQLGFSLSMLTHNRS